ncbi:MULTISPECIES: hypothetical protein [unclassified Pseudomonas]|uniref:hypothetical protein n=1 Tax=Pseudomonas sp. URMO17WK12:I2 TaxID=1261623 RepID=UPI000DB1BB07|nr:MULTISPECIES: hypothetical protein [unclassified Pseudomonas]PZW47218.1 hypothetical protein F469_01086 [Pseudomonas sp. URMO17WK12:I2]
MRNKFATIALALLAIGCTTANASTAGEEEYIAATEIHKTLDSEITNLENNYPGPKAPATLEAVEKLKEYYALLQTSAQKGFPPAMYMTAQIQGSQTSSMYNNKKEICNLLSQAAEANLLAAKHANYYFCSRNGIPFSLDTEEASALIKPLEDALSLSDPYKNFYPLPTIKLPFCRINDTSPTPDIENTNPFTLLTMARKPPLSYEEYLADIHFLLYFKHHEQNQALAEQHKEKSRELGCPGLSFFEPKNT